jgi:hypothetical protein|tara:strand:+ start:3674 stop:3853 length:180 start_codon:yes stop_codon:yes gene_type:complete
MASQAEMLLRDLYEAFYEYEQTPQQAGAIAVAGEYLHEKVNLDGLFPEEVASAGGVKHD